MLTQHQCHFPLIQSEMMGPLLACDLVCLAGCVPKLSDFTSEAREEASFYVPSPSWLSTLLFRSSSS